MADNKIKISSPKAKKGGRDEAGPGYSSRLEVHRLFGLDLDAVLARYPGEYVYKKFIQSVTIEFQNIIRQGMHERKRDGSFKYTDKELMEAALVFEPGGDTDLPSLILEAYRRGILP